NAYKYIRRHISTRGAWSKLEADCFVRTEVVDPRARHRGAHLERAPAVLVDGDRAGERLREQLLQFLQRVLRRGALRLALADPERDVVGERDPVQRLAAGRRDRAGLVGPRADAGDRSIVD